jgi:hypothetical protein
MGATARFDEAVNLLYRVFDRYPFRPNMPCCIPHCMDQVDLDVIGAMPLRNLSAELMRPFVSNLNTTCGDRVDFKFILPRLFELTSEFAFYWPDPDLVLSWLRSEELPTWPHDEQEAVQGFLDAWWGRELEANSDRLTDCFAALTCSGIDVTGWMIRWREVQPVSLAEWINDNIANVWSGKNGNSFANHETVLPQIRGCLADPETADALMRAFHLASDLEEQDVLSLAEDLLRR